MRKAALIPLALLGLLAFLPFAAADFPETWDSYTSGTTSPGQWTQTISAGYGDCFSGTEVDNAGSGSLSAPNVYAFIGANNATCFAGAHNVKLSSNFNASSSPYSTIVLSFYYYPQTSAASNSSDYSFTVSVCGTSLSNLVGVDHSTQKWYNVTDTVTVSTSCTIYLELSTVNAGSGAVGVLIDNLYVNKANQETSGANVHLINAQTGMGFAISNYTGSYFDLSYASGPPTTVNNLRSPYIAQSTTGASLETLWVGSYYYETLIPPVSGNTLFWLYAPTSPPVLFYNLYVQDLSSHFGPGTEVIITQGSRTFSSGYTDTSSNYPVWLIPGTYSVELIDGVNTYSTTANFPSVSGSTVTIQILSETVSSQCGSCTVGYRAGFNPAKTSVIFIFNDTSDTTTTITDSLWVQNVSGSFRLSTNTVHGTYGSYTQTISCNSDQCNSTLAGNLYIAVSYQNAYGQATGTAPLTTPGLFAQLLTISASLLGADAIFSGGNPFPSLFSYIIIAMCSVTFGALSAKFGSIPVAAITALLVFAGWLPLNVGAVTLMAAISFLSFLNYMMRGR